MGPKTSLVFTIIAIVALISCSLLENPASILYDPPVTFSGVVNDSQVTWPGFMLQPNKSILSHDTVKLFFYSEDYSHGSIPTGSYMRLYLLPFPADSQNIISKKNTVLHCELTQNGINQSYQIIPADSDDLDVTLQMDIEHFQREHGAEISLRNIEVRALPVPGTFSPVRLTIDSGVIVGNVQ